MADIIAGGGTPLDANLALYADTSPTQADSPITTTAINVEGGSDAEWHLRWTSLSSTATLQAALQASVDGGSNYGQIAGWGVVPATEDAAGQTVADEEQVHISQPVYIPKNTQADAYSGSLRRTKVRCVFTIGGTGTVAHLQSWLAPMDGGSTAPRERAVVAMY